MQHNFVKHTKIQMFMEMKRQADKTYRENNIEKTNLRKKKWLYVIVVLASSMMD